MCKIVGADAVLAYMLESQERVSRACLHKIRIEVATEFSDVFLKVDGYSVYSAVVMHPELFWMDNDNCVVRAIGSESLYSDDTYLDECYLQSLPESCRDGLKKKLVSSAA